MTVSVCGALPTKSTKKQTPNNTNNTPTTHTTKTQKQCGLFLIFWDLGMCCIVEGERKKKKCWFMLGKTTSLSFSFLSFLHPGRKKNPSLSFSTLTLSSLSESNSFNQKFFRFFFSFPRPSFSFSNPSPPSHKTMMKMMMATHPFVIFQLHKRESIVLPQMGA